MAHLRDTRHREFAEVLEVLSLAERVIRASEGAPQEDVVRFGSKLATVQALIEESRKARDPEPIKHIVVYLCFDDPLRPAGILIAHTHDELLVYNLLKEARKEIAKRKHFATPGMYRVIDEIFTDEHIEYTLVGAGEYREMEFVL